MAKVIVCIQVESIGRIEVGKKIYSDGSGPWGNQPVKEIKYSCGACGEDYYQESYTIHFENNTKTLEVFDVNYVIRDEV